MEDYLDIHVLLDSSRGAFPDVRHRAATHTSWFITTILPLIFGETRQNSNGDTYSVRDVAEQHVLEDFQGNFIPSLQDFLEQIPLQDWMDNGLNGDLPSSRKALADIPNRPPTVSPTSPWHEPFSTIEDEFDVDSDSIHRPCGGAGVMD